MLPKGFKHTEETKRKMSIRGKKYWSNFENKERRLGENHPMFEKHHSEETKRKISKANKGKQYNLGYKHTEKTKIKMSKKAKNLWKNSEYKRKMSLVHKKRLSNSENHPNWQGGKSFEPYSSEFNYNLKELIRNRDNRICQLCGKKQKELIGYHKKLDIHHIDFNKKNCKEENLITLCRNCNAITNSNRNYWTEYFQGVINAYN